MRYEMRFSFSESWSYSYFVACIFTHLFSKCFFLWACHSSTETTTADRGAGGGLAAGACISARQALHHTAHSWQQQSDRPTSKAHGHAGHGPVWRFAPYRESAWGEIDDWTTHREEKRRRKKENDRKINTAIHWAEIWMHKKKKRAATNRTITITDLTVSRAVIYQFIHINHHNIKHLNI